jgi:hypothetical protein
VRSFKPLVAATPLTSAGELLRMAIPACPDALRFARGSRRACGPDYRQQVDRRAVEIASDSIA